MAVTAGLPREAAPIQKKMKIDNESNMPNCPEDGEPPES
jgi:hypothetical protein